MATIHSFIHSPLSTNYWAPALQKLQFYREEGAWTCITVSWGRGGLWPFPCTGRSCSERYKLLNIATYITCLRICTWLMLSHNVQASRDHEPMHLIYVTIFKKWVCLYLSDWLWLLLGLGSMPRLFNWGRSTPGWGNLGRLQGGGVLNLQVEEQVGFTKQKWCQQHFR